jgi:murein DD-endopeptidase MepM/ murein hydrolase activator NlpD
MQIITSNEASAVVRANPRASFLCPIVLAVVLVTGCRVLPDSEKDVVDTAAATLDTQTIELSNLPRSAPVITDTLVALDTGGPIQVDTPGRAIARQDELRALAATLTIPVAGVKAEDLLDTFKEMRGTRKHEALDIPAPRGTPVLSATDGRVLRLYTSERGGLMIYAADSSERFILMYAHLDGYADRVSDGTSVRRGQVIGYVGTTGNAPPNLPHLHFAIARSTKVSRWWEGTPVDPLPLLVK